MTSIYEDIIKRLDSLAIDIAALTINEGAGAAGGAITGSGTTNRITQWTGASSLGDSTLIKSGAGVLTLSAAADYTLTVPATGTAVLGSGGSGQIAYWNGTNSQTGSATAKLTVGAQTTTLTVDHEFSYLKLFASSYDPNSSSIYFARNGLAGENIAGIRLSQTSGPVGQPQLDIGIVQLGVTGSTLSFSTYDDTLGNVPGVVFTPTDVRLHVSGIQTGNLAKLAVGGGIWASGQVQSTLATGTAPFVIASTTVSTNLNADLLDGVHASELVNSSLLTTRGDIIRRGASAPERYGLVVPAAGVLNYLGVANGETDLTWKSASSNPGAAAAILASNASGYLRLVRLGLGADPTTALSFATSTASSGGICSAQDISPEPLPGLLQPAE